MEAEVDTKNRDGERLPQVARTAPAYATDVFHSVDAAADEHVKAIIAGNSGGPTRTAHGPDPVPKKPSAIVEQAPEPSPTKAAAAARDRAL
jgi:hypothetical protein